MRHSPLLFLILISVLSFSYASDYFISEGEGCIPDICIEGICASEDILTEPLQEPSADEPPVCKQTLINDAFCKQVYGNNFSFVASEMGCFKEPNIIIKTLKEIGSGFWQALGTAICAALLALIPPVRKTISQILTKLLGRNKTETPPDAAESKEKTEEQLYPYEDI